MHHRNLARRRKAGAEAGISTIELGLLGPLLVLLLFGAGDFGRIFYAGVTVANAAGAGALYGSWSPANARDTDGMKKAVANESENLSGVTATPTNYCQCSDGSVVSCATLQCADLSKPRFYVKVTANYSFQTLVSYAGIPKKVDVGKTVVMRVR